MYTPSHPSSTVYMKLGFEGVFFRGGGYSFYGRVLLEKGPFVGRFSAQISRYYEYDVLP